MAHSPQHLALVLVSIGVVSIGVASCSSAPEDDNPIDPVATAKATPLPDLKQPPPTTVEQTLDPAVARQSAAEGPNPSEPAGLRHYQEFGAGDTRVSAGWPIHEHKLPGAEPPAPGPNRTRLLRFVHMPDLQIADDESPTRMASFDMPTQLSSAMRPQDGELCRMTNAAVRTIRAFHKRDPFSFLLLGGDNSDNAQENEVDWALDILQGKEVVECDSGADDDPVPGPDNDGKDPFVAPGLGFPFFWVTGNHDISVQGNLAIDENLAAQTVGTTAANGTRDYSQPGAPPRTGDFVVADERRRLLSRQDLMGRIAAHGDGHGIGPEQIESGEATYTFDPPGDTPFRFLVIDTAHAPGGASGVIRQSHIDRFITPMLEKAQADGKWVFLASHHASKSLTSNGGAFGREQPDPVLEPEWLAYLGRYPNVIGSFVGHSHEHLVRALPTGERHIWEMMTSSIADFPNQFRIFEIYDEDNGWLSVEGIAVDFSVEGDRPAQMGREKSVIDFTSGWIESGLGQLEHRNVKLWLRKP